MGVRGAIQAAFPDQYQLILGGIVAAAIAAGVAYAVSSIRERRALRFGMIGAALAGGAAYSWAMATGSPYVDAVERFHFVEYGFLTLLYLRVWRDRPVAPAALLAFLAVFMVGTLDEGIQWFVPLRVGEWADVLLNSAAILCGLVFGLALFGHAGTTPAGPARWRGVAPMLGAAAALLGVFVYLVHVGYDVHDSSIGSFRSRYSTSQLLAHAADREARWRTAPLTTLRRYSQEDQYMSEGLWHVQARNEAADDPVTQWRENLILERYFAPVLDFPTYNTPHGSRWPAEQRENVRKVAEGDSRPWTSAAHPYPIYAWLPDQAAEGRVVVATLHSRALEGNRIGDTADRQVTVYLPPAYHRNPAERFPVVYLLHGFTSDPVEWLDGSYQGLNLATALDQQAGAGATQYIVVMPLTNNAVGGAFYVNSAAFGQWDDFVSQELVAFVDARYRTRPSRASRVVAGQSMGGFGALYLAGRHPDVFAHAYAMSACCTGFVGDLAAEGSRWQGEPRGWHRAMAMAFSANPPADPLTAPLSLPFVKGGDGAMHEVPEVVSAWRGFMPLYRLTQDPAPYRALCTIGLEAGASDEISNVTIGTRAFSDALTRAGIQHTYVEFPGGHVDRTRDRFERAVLPFFARALAVGTAAGTCRP